MHMYQHTTTILTTIRFPKKGYEMTVVKISEDKNKKYEWKKIFKREIQNAQVKIKCIKITDPFDNVVYELQMR